MLKNRLHTYRLRRGWSQHDLARRAGISRAGVSAIETNRLVPSAAAALSLAMAFGCHVEDLFSLAGSDTAGSNWAWPPASEPCRFWHAEVAGRTLRYPVENNGLGVTEHDGLCRDGSFVENRRTDPRDTLVMACCDPAAGLLAAEMARSWNLRLLVLIRSSRQALRLVSQNLVHVAGVHLARAEKTGGNAAVAREVLGEPFACLRLACWQEGLTIAPGSAVRSIREVLRADLRWVGREPGSGARQCLDELLGHHRPPRRIAHDHRGVAEAVRCGWAEAGVCLRIASEEAGLGFFSVREEAYDLCYPSRYENDPRLRALVEVVRTPSYRRVLGELPGYDSSETGEIEHVC